MIKNPEVLIVGAGPTGLVLALWLTKMGVRVRIVDRATEPGTTSRALGVQARTLELYAMMGLAGEVVARGRQLSAANMWVASKREAHMDLGEMGKGLSPFPYLLIFPQDEHERLLIEHLKSSGVEVDRRVEVLGFDEAAGHVRARLRRGGAEAEETCEAAYIVGCDGAHSIVRSALGIGLPGGTYDRLFYVADVQAKGPVANGELHLALDDDAFLAVFPLKGEGRVRLIGTVRVDAEKSNETLGWGDVSANAIERTRIEVDRVNWFSTYRVHHRVASQFRKGRAFLAGDAAHIHSPVGGQGMNTGIGDAVNLAWKLAAVVRGRAAPWILDTYEPERIAFAKRLVATTDRVFQLASKRGPLAGGLRTRVFPSLVSRLSKFPALQRLLFKTISQTRIQYRHSPLSEGSVGRVRGGDRLPWVAADAGGSHFGSPEDNFATLNGIDWQVHVYGDDSPRLRATCDARGVRLHVLPWGPPAEQAGLVKNAVYLIRPDGYVALAHADGDPGAIERYFDRLASTLYAPPTK